MLSSLLGQLAAVEVDDLPGLVKYCISSADKTHADQVCHRSSGNLNVWHSMGVASLSAPPPKSVCGPGALLHANMHRTSHTLNSAMVLLQVLTIVRSGLHFVSASDPRLAIPDQKQKGAKVPKSKSPEALLVKELVSALQGNEAAAAACLQLVGAITGM